MLRAAARRRDAAAHAGGARQPQARAVAPPPAARARARRRRAGRPAEWTIHFAAFSGRLVQTMCAHSGVGGVGKGAGARWVRSGRPELLQHQVQTIVQHARLHGFGCLRARAKPTVPGAPPGVPAAATVLLAIEATLCEPLASGGESGDWRSLVRTLARTVHGDAADDF